MEKKLDQDHRLLAEKLDSFEVTDFSKDEVWGDISARVFTKKVKKFWWWYAVAAVLLLAGTFFMIPDQELNMADAVADSIPKQSSEMAREPLTDKNTVASKIEPVKLSKNEEIKTKRGFENTQPTLTRATSMATTSQKKSLDAEKPINETASQNHEIGVTVTEKMITKSEVNLNVKNTEALEIQRRAEKPKPVLKIAEAELNQSPLASNAEKMEGKKLVLIIEDLEEGRTNKKVNLFQKIGNFNRTGDWEKTENEKKVWARFIESTKPDRKTL
jgi:hypothetical protein